MSYQNLEFVAKLKPQYDSAKSFYGKAKIFRNNEGGIFLQSYDTIVVEVWDEALYGVGAKYVVIHGWYSRTTMRHINEFLLQYTNCNRKLSKKEVEGGETLWL